MFNFFKRHPKTKYFVILFAIFIAFISLLPIALQWGGEYALKQQGAKQASIEDIDLNLFTGKFTLKNLAVNFAKKGEPIQLQRAYIDLYVPDIFSKLIHIQNIEIEGLDTHVTRTENKLQINGYVIDLKSSASETPQTEPAKHQWGILLAKSQLNNLNIDYNEPELNQKLHIQKLAIQNINTLDAHSTSKLQLQMNEAKTNIQSDVSMQLFQKQRNFNGHLSVRNLTPKAYKKFYKAYLDKLTASLNIETTFNVELGKTLKAEVKQQLDLKNLKLEHKQVQQQLKSLSWTGQASIKGEDVSVSGNLKLKDSLIEDLKTKQLIQSFAQLTLDKFQYQHDQIQFDTLTINKLQALKLDKQPTLLALDELQLHKFVMQPQQSNLNLAKASITALTADATLNANKKIDAIETLQTTLNRITPKQTETSTQTSTTSSKPLQLHIGQLEIKKPSKIHFVDQSVTPNFNTHLAIEQLAINNISQQSPADFDIQLKQGEYGQIKMKGTGLLFKPKQQLKVNIDIKQLDLPPITPYSTPSIGYAINSGVVDSTIKASIKDSHIDSDVKMTIDSIEIVEGNKKSAEELASASGMSIDLALSTLKDSDNVIDLDVPIKGDLNSPDFDVSLVINKALGGAMKAASLFYLKNSLQPFGSLLTLYSLAKKAINSMALAPVEFEPNQTKLREKQIQLLDKIVKVLKERPGIKIKTCAVSNLDDKQAIIKALTPKPKKGAKKTSKKPVKFTVPEKQLSQALITLADKRSAVVKDYISKQKGIAPKRILNCLSAKNVKDKDIKPAVELLI